jgi:hypothetical protein
MVKTKLEKVKVHEDCTVHNQNMLKIYPTSYEGLSAFQTLKHSLQPEVMAAVKI